ncbi:MAG TPA: hydrogenase maturation nickel metallochaperone HypA [Candidatus Limiplasma sp.]|nr:hydrogenase maturation nickel metallochaperone HypA [Candidatus Limiplasma sp.]HPS80837.1 hydrogenase maturation nickel metallochaperone HypA [Candidatus Limiplasma sp.]
MHELGIVAEIVRIVEDLAHRQALTQIDTLVLQIGELSSVVPYYVEQCYPAASFGTMLEKTKLAIEILPANGRCRACGKVYNVLAHHRQCPECGESAFDLLGGREFLIKQIIAC